MIKNLQVLLADATEENSSIFLPVSFKRRLKLLPTGAEFRKLLKNGAIAQHVYLVSQSTISEGDYYIDMELVTLGSVENTVHKAGFSYKKDGFDVHFKIEASTDLSLRLPGIPKDFIEKLVESNGGIRQVKVKWSKEFDNPVLNPTFLSVEVVVVN